MAENDCVVETNLEGTGNTDDVNNNDGSGDITEPTPRQRLVGKMRTVMNAYIYQELPAEITRQDITPFRHMSERYWRENGVPWKNFQTTLGDRFRFEAKTHWGRRDVFTQDDRSVETGVFNYIDSGLFRPSQRTREVRGVPFTLTSISPAEPDNRPETQNVQFLKDFYKKQTIVITPRREYFSRFVQGQREYFQPLWRIWCAGDVNLHNVFGLGDFVTREEGNIAALFDTEREFSDHAFRMSAPVLPKELVLVDGLPRPAIAKADMEYNFYVREYEAALARILATGQPLETVLPSMYIFLSEKKSSNLDSDNSLFRRHITLNGILEDVSVDVIRGGKKVGEEDDGQYFDKWARGYDELYRRTFIIGEPRFRELDFRYKKIIFSPLDMENLKSFNEKRFLFPMFVDIEFSTDRATLLAEAIKEAQLGTSLIQAATYPPRETIEGDAWKPRILNYRVASESISVDGDNDKIVEVSGVQQRVALDIIPWWNAFKNRQTETSMNSVTLGSGLPELFVTENEQYRFVQTILSIVFSGKIKNVLNGRLRSFEDIMNGKHAYSETVFYKISKHSIVNGETGPVIQDFYIPNSNELDIARFVDTQVVFDKKYRYNVYAYELVFGTAYKYVPNSAAPDVVLNSSAIVDVYTRPEIRLIETDYFSFDTQISDKPPLTPDVNLVPYRGVSDRLLINLNAQVGELRAQPITFNAREQERIDEIRSRHDLEPTDPIDYKGDDPIDIFEIYRTTRRPRDYSDFADRLHIEVDTEVLPARPGETGLPALSSAAVIDSLVPNTKYYYTFRAVDVRGNVSNPSAVYSVEMVEESGVTYPVIELYDFVEAEPERKTKTFKKYIHIVPSSLQSELEVPNFSEVESAEAAEVRLGTVEDRIFAIHPSKKKIKLRITSKHSGKKIDINLNFSHKHTS
jgi:hypothetical protein